MFSFSCSPQTESKTPVSVVTQPKPSDLVNTSIEQSLKVALVQAAQNSGLTLKKKSGKRRRKDTSLSKTWNIQSMTFPGTSMKYPDNKIRTYIQTVAPVQYFSTLTSGPQYSSYNFVASSLDQFSSLAAIDDQYRVDELEVWIYPTPSSSDTQNSLEGGLFYTAVDYDDANVPTSIGQLVDYENNVTTSTACGHYRRFKPHVAIAAFSGTFTSYANVEDEWIDAASNNVQFYGLKMATSTTQVVIPFTLHARVHLSVRNTR
jgi:hypothetical protein